MLLSSDYSCILLLIINMCLIRLGNVVKHGLIRCTEDLAVLWSTLLLAEEFPQGAITKVPSG